MQFLYYGRWYIGIGMFVNVVLAVKARSCCLNTEISHDGEGAAVQSNTKHSKISGCGRDFEMGTLSIHNGYRSIQNGYRTFLETLTFKRGRASF